MRAPGCPEHGNLVLDLVHGQLDDLRAEKAETVRSECAVCARWWNDAFAEEALADLGSVVAEVFENFVPPRRRQSAWLAVAATVILAVGLAAIVLIPYEGGISPSGTAPRSTTGPEISRWNFEESNVGTVAATVADTPVSGERAVFESGFESGTVSSWSSHG